MLRRLLFPLIAAALGLAAMGGVQASDAAFVSSTTYGAQVTAAADWAPPTVSLTAPAAYLTGATTISATAADTGSGVLKVVIQYAVSGSGSWTTICTDTTAPYSCSWVTAGVVDGSYDLRAIATDNAAFTATSGIATTSVANTSQVVLTAIANPASGSITLKADYLNPGPPLRLYFEYVAAGGSSWSAVPGCGSTGTPSTTRTCTWASTVTGTYDIRAVGTDGAAFTLYGYQYNVKVDNTAPTTVLTVPAGTLSGTVSLTATASDSDSGMGSVAFQYRKVGASPFTTPCTVNAAPYTCSLNTAPLSDGSYEFRAIGTDLAGNSTTTALQTRSLNNTVSTVSITAPTSASTVRGAVTVTASAASNRGVTQVVIETRVTGSGTWTPLCTPAGSPYSCPWNTSAIATASYDLHAVLTDGGGTVTTSAVVTVSVDNTLHGLDVQATNGTTAGLPATNDTLVLTYSNLVNPATILAGWNGSSTAITVTFKSTKVAGGPVAGEDYATFGTANLGSVAFAQGYVKNNKTAVFTATMVASTQTVGGFPVSVVTVTLGTTPDSANLTTAAVTGTMTWAPSIAASTAAGIACAATAVTESGTLDQDL